MKVCHMTSAHESHDTRIFYKECSSLAKNGYETYLVASDMSREENGVHVIGLGEAPRKRAERMTVFAKEVYKKALELDCDLYHFHDPELLPYGLKLKRNGKKVIFDSHENTLEQINEKEWIPDVFRKLLYSVFDCYQRNVCRKLDAVISVTPHICDYFQKINPATYMIANFPVFQEQGEQVRSENRSLCFAGGIVSQWNHDKIIQAMEEIENCTYVLCGKAGTVYFKSLTALPAWNKVDYRGVLPHAEINKVLSGCGIGVSLLSYNHNTGFKTGTMGNTKIFEEMMAGLPVICTDFDLWREFVERYHCGICVNPVRIDEIADAIRYLLDNPEEAKRMGENGRRAIKEEFNWGVEEQKLFHLYAEITKEDRPE